MSDAERMTTLLEKSADQLIEILHHPENEDLLRNFVAFDRETEGYHLIEFPERWDGETDFSWAIRFASWETNKGKFDRGQTSRWRAILLSLDDGSWSGGVWLGVVQTAHMRLRDG